MSVRQYLTSCVPAGGAITTAPTTTTRIMVGAEGLTRAKEGEGSTALKEKLETIKGLNKIGARGNENNLAEQIVRSGSSRN